MVESLEIKLKEYVPIKDRICIEWIEETQLKEIKFHGNPVNILALKKSENPIAPEKTNIDERFKFKKDPTSKNVILKNKLKNNGKNNKATGIKNLKLSSYVNELVIQYSPLR